MNRKRAVFITSNHEFVKYSGSDVLFRHHSRRPLIFCLTITVLIVLHIPYICCCCSAYLSSCHRTASDANLFDDPHTFHCNDYFVIGVICTCFGVFDDPMFQWISSYSCPLNLLHVRSHPVDIIIVKRLIQGRTNVTRVRVEPRSFDQGRRKNDSFTLSAALFATKFLFNNILF